MIRVHYELRDPLRKGGRAFRDLTDASHAIAFADRIAPHVVVAFEEVTPLEMVKDKAGARLLRKVP